MNEINQRLVKCFQTVFPDLSDAAVLTASQHTVKEWDSIAAITLVNVIEEEFGIELDLDKIADLDSFEKVSEYLKAMPALT